MPRCQVCGRKTALRAGMLVRMHHVAGEVCLGSAYPPIEVDDARLVELARELDTRASTLRHEIAKLYNRRANYIPSELVDRGAVAASLAARLERRLRRHQSWPDRFAKQMAQRGYGDPPPNYLLERSA